GFIAFIFLTPGANAATIDEILIMSDAGIPTDVIIEVVEATGLDDDLDEDAILKLVDADLDPTLLQYLLSFLPDSENSNLVDDSNNPVDNSLSNNPNWAGGPGFSHGGTGYNPLNDRSDPNVYWEGPAYSDTYYRDNYNNYYYPRNLGVVVYEPPVYQLYSHPYVAIPLQRYYNYSTGYWYNGQYVIYDGNRTHNYDNPWYYDQYQNYYYGNNGCGYPYGWGGSFGGSWHNQNGRNWWDSWGDAEYHGERVNLRISF
ncbi:MAG: hypothetical protein NTY09_04175, partial [bacterium]|nr:hypothetical protein [bacterium]